jgi:hypothetical protein
MGRAVIIACGIASSILYVVTDLVASHRYSGYSYRDQWFSELLADHAPTRPLMIATNAIPYTALVIAFSLGSITEPQFRLMARISGAMLLGYAITGAVGVAHPMQTRAAIVTNSNDSQNMAHIASTAAMSVLLLLAMGFGARAFGPLFRRYTYLTIAVLLVFGGLTGRAAGRIDQGLDTPWSGIMERVNIYASMLWIAMLSVGLIRQLAGCHPDTAHRNPGLLKPGEA